MSTPQKYYGKYRGTVLMNIDPQQSGRMLVQVPDVFGLGTSSWAVACVPLAGKQTGAWFVPTIGTGVWVEFEKGDPDYPIWSGCWWGSAAEPPALALAGLPVSPSIVLQTTAQNTLMISDMPGPAGGILLKTLTGALISVNDVGITISNGKGAIITMTGPAITMVGSPLTINAGALTVI